MLHDSYYHIFTTYIILYLFYIKVIIFFLSFIHILYITYFILYLFSSFYLIFFLSSQRQTNYIFLKYVTDSAEKDEFTQNGVGRAQVMNMMILMLTTDF